MHIENLVKMANQIGSYFDAYPDREMARNEVAGHIKRNWEPRMRRAILAHIEAGGEQELLPLVVEAIKSLPPPPPPQQ